MIAYKKGLLLCLILIFATQRLIAQSIEKVDVCIYGGTSAGVIAAYTARKLHKTVLLIEPGNRLGGLTTGGLGYTDIGNKYAITGLARDYYRRIGKHYGRFEQWIFEPKVALQIFQQYIDDAQLNIRLQHRLASVKKVNGSITEIEVTNLNSGKNIQVKAGMFIDCSYEGDLMAKAGVSYMVGREANADYNETYNGIQLREKHQFPDSINPYKEPGKPGSGLLWGISPEPLGTIGAGDKKVQTYNFRICLTNDPTNRIEITRPEDYDPARYELLLRVLEKRPAKDLNGIMKVDLMPNHKTDINNNGAFSTDMIGENYNYPEGDAAIRKAIIKKHENYTKGFLYFVGHDSRMPQHLRDMMLQWGYPKDEYTDNGNWTPQLYIREARRMKGAYIMTQANCEARETVTDGIGMAAYTMDSHNCQRIVVNGMVKNEGDVQIGGFGPYPISYRSIIPKADECKNLFVPVCLSATHIAYGSIRMEPVFMELGQSAAVAAVEALNTGTTVQNVDIKKVQQSLLDNPLVNGKIQEVLVDNDDTKHVVVTGNWKKQKGGSYGPSLYANDSKGGEAGSVRFNVDIPKDGKYRVYSYLPKLENAALHTHFTIFDGNNKHDHAVDASAIKVEGQTSGEWIDLGAYSFKKEGKAYVEINNEKADGVVVADAILFIPE
ncbi:FAD-dependent oxidoreductase [Danxiaibacter flavus]|uniref:FAD-dependent oxidoreductase n=1 Tax=Danxiaibacter flavus TaxID=3049108 RepID=A0ABV3ZDJ8_9BACT|nr:FAD-dependent oxidoreductase [Chitinophagaceae bacterium DXS]